MTKYRIKEIEYNNGVIRYIPQKRIGFLWFALRETDGLVRSFRTQQYAKNTILELQEREIREKQINKDWEIKKSKVIWQSNTNKEK